MINNNTRVKQRPAYDKYVDKIEKQEFVAFFSSCKPEQWFSSRELKAYSSPGNAGSLAGRYLIKRMICDYIKDSDKMHEIEIWNDDFGKPEVLLSADIQHSIEQKGIKKVICSISHSKNLITGMTIFCF
jgi:phosphopantetheinyl transferase (holo-ACP synthase)